MKFIYIVIAIQFLLYAFIIWAVFNLLSKFAESDTAGKLGNKFERWLEN